METPYCWEKTAAFEKVCTEREGECQPAAFYENWLVISRKSGSREVSGSPVAVFFFLEQKILVRPKIAMTVHFALRESCLGSAFPVPAMAYACPAAAMRQS